MAEDQTQSPATTAASIESSSPLPADWEATLRKVVAAEVRRSMNRAYGEASRKFSHDAEIAGLVHLLAARSNDTKDEVLRKALTLYGLALDAREKGNKLAVISPDDFIVHDVVGFEPIIESLTSA